jgi:glycosyltransferase involved in cell wall biosynthesis
MRLLYDHQVFSLQNAGGASRYYYELMKFFTTVPEVDTRLLLGISGTVYPFRQLNSAGTRVKSFREWLPPGLWRYIANDVWSNLAAPFSGKFDVYHPTEYLRMPMVRARRVVATHHDCTHELYPEMFPKRNKVLWARKRLFPRVDAIICISESCRQDLLRFYNVDPGKTRVIHHGVSPLPRSPEAARRLRTMLRREYLLYVGLRYAFKNFHALLQAFRDTGLHETFDLLVLGGGPFNAAERELIARLELGDSIITLPRVSDELLAEAYANAKLFVYPSRSEGFGLPPLEAMSLDCPVLAGRASSIPEVCQDAPFYLDPGDQHSFHRELARAVSDEPARRRSIERGREVVARYSWEKCGRETLDLYRACQ